MSFFDDLIDFGKNIFSGSGSILAPIATTILTGYALNKVTSSINKQNSLPSTATNTPTEPDRGVRLQVNPDPQHKIPVVYGSAYLGGIITDAALTNSNKTMWYCITICEKTGVIYSSGTNSQFTFEDVYWNDQRIVFESDGITAAYTIDRDGNVDKSLAGLVRIYCYNGASTLPVVFDNYTAGALSNAYALFPNWTTNHTMSDLIFALVRVDYSKEKNVTNLGTLNWHVTNTMTKPGDCLLDYMTSTRYGAGLSSGDIYIV